MALDFARSSGRESWGATVLIAGDNPNIRHYCASQGRRDSADVHAILDGPLALAASSGRKFEWVLIPPAFNPDAHDAARIAATHAVSLAGRGPIASVQWTD